MSIDAIKQLEELKKWEEEIKGRSTDRDKDRFLGRLKKKVKHTIGYESRNQG
ncbi:hypothetical protein [Salinithrix halophila]|uniref:Uncharacterized protein n=1 Tax=Salinithrix halophila TaxID=1485204 RepID=A0ABV8JNK8_9BACL